MKWEDQRNLYNNPFIIKARYLGRLQTGEVKWLLEEVKMVRTQHDFETQASQRSMRKEAAAETDILASDEFKNTEWCL